MLDLSEKKKISNATHWYQEINQLYHPTGKFGQDSQDLVYSFNNLNTVKFIPIILKEWFFLLKKDGYLVIDYKPNKICDFRKLEKNMWWLWKNKYEIIYHGSISGKHTAALSRQGLRKYINEKEAYTHVFLDNLTKIPPPSSTKMTSATKNGYLRFICKKTESTLIDGDNINKWTFGIITNGQRKDWLDQIINSIRIQKIPNYEIVICGTYYGNKEKDIIYIPFNQRDDLGWITRKKNLIVKNAKYENLCIIHDRAIFSKNWFKEMKRYGNCFEIMCNRQYFKGMRAYDWTSLGGPNGTLYKMLMLDYRDWDWWSVIGGLQTISKKSILQNIPFDETRYWNEMEDSELTFNLRDAGHIARINQSEISTLGFRHGLIPSKPYDRQFYWPDLILRRIMRKIARFTVAVPWFHKELEKFTQTWIYKKVIKIS